MRVEFVNNKLKLKNNFSLHNYPLHWIKNCEAMDVEDIAKLIFNESSNKLKEWKFSSSNVMGDVRYGVCTYVNNHIARTSQISSFYNRDSMFLRGIYYADLGKYGRLGGASARGVGKGVNETFLKFKGKTFKSFDTRKYLIESKINVVFPFTLHAPAPDVTIRHLFGGDDGLETNRIYTIFSLSGPHSGQPLQSGRGQGRASSVGSIWYNHPNEYRNPRHAGLEIFSLDRELQRAEKPPGVLAILMQDEPVFTEEFKEKYLYIKKKTRKIVFSTYNWGAYYGSKDSFYKKKRIDVLAPFAQYSDLYMNVLYSFTPKKHDFDDVDHPEDTTLHLKKRLEEEKYIIESSYESATGLKYDKPFCTVLQGFGTTSRKDINFPIMPDPDYMRAQIWTAVCCDYVGISFFAQANESNKVSLLISRERDPVYPNIEGISPFSNDSSPWYAMAENFRLISKFESVLLSNVVHIYGLLSNEKIAYTLREHDGFIYLFMINMFRATESASIFFHFLRGDFWSVADVLKGIRFSCSGTKSISFSKFELKIYQIGCFYE